jgi:hypothetical protein
MYAAHGELHNSALVLKQIIEKNLKTRSSLGKKGVSDISGYFCPPEGVFVTLGSFCTLCTEKRLYYPCLFCHGTCFADTGQFKIDTQETFTIHAVKPLMPAQRTGIVVRAYRADARIAVLCHDI